MYNYIYIYVYLHNRQMIFLRKKKTNGISCFPRPLIYDEVFWSLLTAMPVILLQFSLPLSLRFSIVQFQKVFLQEKTKEMNTSTLFI